MRARCRSTRSGPGKRAITSWITVSPLRTSSAERRVPVLAPDEHAVEELRVASASIKGESRRQTARRTAWLDPKRWNLRARGILPWDNPFRPSRRRGRRRCAARGGGVCGRGEGKGLETKSRHRAWPTAHLKRRRGAPSRETGPDPQRWAGGAPGIQLARRWSVGVGGPRRPLLARAGPRLRAQGHIGRTRRGRLKRTHQRLGVERLRDRRWRRRTRAAPHGLPHGTHSARRFGRGVALTTSLSTERDALQGLGREPEHRQDVAELGKGNVRKAVVSVNGQRDDAAPHEHGKHGHSASAVRPGQGPATRSASRPSAAGTATTGAATRRARARRLEDEGVPADSPLGPRSCPHRWRRAPRRCLRENEKRRELEELLGKGEEHVEHRIRRDSLLELPARRPPPSAVPSARRAIGNPSPFGLVQRGPLAPFADGRPQDTSQRVRPRLVRTWRLGGRRPPRARCPPRRVSTTRRRRHQGRRLRVGGGLEQSSSARRQRPAAPAPPHWLPHLPPPRRLPRGQEACLPDQRPRPSTRSKERAFSMPEAPEVDAPPYPDLPGYRRRPRTRSRQLGAERRARHAYRPRHLQHQNLTVRRRRRARTRVAAAIEAGRKPQVLALKGQSVIDCDGLANAHQRRNELAHRDVEREAKIFLNRLGQGLGGRQDEGLVNQLNRKDGMTERKVAGNEAQHGLRRRPQGSDGGRRPAEPLS